MRMWTKTYLNSREAVGEMTANIVEKLEEEKFQLKKITPIDDYFLKPSNYHRDTWEKNNTKERMLLLYYTGLAVVSLSYLVYLITFVFSLSL